MKLCPAARNVCSTKVEMAARQHPGAVHSEALQLQHAPCTARLGRAMWPWLCLAVLGRDRWNQVCKAQCTPRPGPQATWACLGSNNLV